jgi:hypothetical protein
MIPTACDLPIAIGMNPQLVMALVVFVVRSKSYPKNLTKGR